MLGFIGDLDLDAYECMFQFLAKKKFQLWVGHHGHGSNGPKPNKACRKVTLQIYQTSTIKTCTKYESQNTSHMSSSLAPRLRVYRALQRRQSGRPWVQDIHDSPKIFIPRLYLSPKYLTILISNIHCSNNGTSCPQKKELVHTYPILFHYVFSLPLPLRNQPFAA